MENVFPGQRVRSREKLEGIFKNAHLRYDICSEREKLGQKGGPTLAWVLY